MPLRLVTSGGRPEILVDRGVVVVGRHPRCDFRLVSPRVSRWHCCLIEVDGELWVRDLGSSNGIWINGRRVMSARVGPGDVLSIAHIRYRLEQTQDNPPSMAESRDRLDEGSLYLADPHGTELADERDGD